MRRIVAFIEADEDKLLNLHPEDGVGVAFEKEMNWVVPCGIKVESWAVSDADDTEPYARYLDYLFAWTMDHVEDFDNMESPMSYAQWKEREAA